MNCGKGDSILIASEKLTEDCSGLFFFNFFTMGVFVINSYSMGGMTICHSPSDLKQYFSRNIKFLHRTEILTFSPFFLTFATQMLFV